MPVSRNRLSPNICFYADALPGTNPVRYHFRQRDNLVDFARSYLLSFVPQAANPHCTYHVRNRLINTETSGCGTRCTAIWDNGLIGCCFSRFSFYCVGTDFDPFSSTHLPQVSSMLLVNISSNSSKSLA